MFVYKWISSIEPKLQLTGNIKKLSLHTLLWVTSACVETFIGSTALTPGCASESPVAQTAHLGVSNSADVLKPL